MYLHAHASIGWILAEAGRGDVRFRRTVFLAAIAPDLDGITYVLGSASSIDQHHIWTHNLAFSWLVSLLASLYCGPLRWRAVLITQLAFYSHYFGDYFFTTWPLYYFAPFSMQHFVYRRAWPLWDPVNQWIGLAGCLIVLALALRSGRTPLEAISPRLDARLLARMRSFWQNFTKTRRTS